MTELAIRPAAPTLLDKVNYAEKLANSGLLPSQYRAQPANVLYAIEYGEMLNLSPMAAINGIHVIEGKPTASAGLIAALVRRAGHRLRVSGDDRRAVAEIVRSDDPEFVFRAEWTIERAIAAGLVEEKNGKLWSRDSKGRPKPWERYPAAMLKARAVSEAARDACEEALSGVHYTPEELGADVDEEGVPVVTAEQAGPAQAHPWAAPATRDFLAEANAATNAETVREIYRAAFEASMPDVVLTQITNIGKRLAEAAASPDRAEQPAGEGDGSDQGNDSNVIEAEIVPGPGADREQALAALRAEAARHNVAETDLDGYAGDRHGRHLSELTIAEIREMTQVLAGAK
ncbi:recombinase RecT [Yinghuangia soli]|uniref:Recombinase RecT n=1 Tax=Yinghuangia soli TaxID=2908204 RepID=A0AA41U2E7_9ACTN|nr:recombinase RecT [Yinghuangia soli]MCF2531718.1 recombinase RecT [Yinghuangia soli]